MESVSFSEEATTYLIFGGCVQFFWSVLAAPFLYLIATAVTKKSFHRLFRAYVILNMGLLLWGCVGNYFFMSFAYGKLYINTSHDPNLDWYAFIPFFRGIDPIEFIGDATLGQVRLLGLAIALPVWLLALASSWLVLRFLPPPQADCRQLSGDLASSRG